ncbi:MAG: hypothetical protein IKP78_03865 [Ruminococcus sp.]|nr:hypothetical protein [Ruminococcus sp.]
MLTVKTHPTLEGYKKYWWSRPRSWFNLLLPVPMILFELLQLAGSLLLFAAKGEGLFYAFVSVLFIVLGILFMVWACYIPRKLYNASQKLCSDVTETVTFGDDSFTAVNVGSKIDERVTNMYSSVTSAKSGGGWFVIICDKYRFYTFKETEFTEGTPDALRSLLSVKLGNKFKR